MKIYEYKCVSNPYVGMTVIMDEEGLKGWEVVAIDFRESKIYFKREILSADHG